MEKKFLSNVILGALLIFTMAGCTRSAETDTTQLKLVLPQADAVSLSKRKKMSAMMNAPEPTGFTGSAPINCYLVGVGGPEPEMSKNFCYSDISGESNVVGVWAGAIPSNKEVSLTVPSGKNRIVSLYGVHAPDLAFCRDFKVYGFPQGELSNLYFLGRANVAEMSPGATVEVNLPVAFDPNNESHCEGEDFPDDHGGGWSVATRVEIEKEHFPREMGVLNQCMGVDLVFRDDQGRHASLDQSTFIEIHDSGGVALDIFASHQDCIDDLFIGDIEVFAGQDRASFYIKPATVGALTLVPFDTNDFVIGQGRTLAIVNDTPTPTGVRMDTPWSILASTCYPVTLSARTFQDGPATSGGDPSFGITNIGGLSGGLYTTTNCSGSPITSGTVPAAGTGATFYLKVNSGTSNFMALEFDPISPVGNSRLSQKTRALVRVGGGDTVPKYLWANGPNNGPVYNTCFSSNPYSVELRNSQGTTILAPAGGLQFYASDASSFDIFLDSSCTTQITAAAPATIAGGASTQPIYLKPRWGEQGTLVLRNSTNTVSSNFDWLFGINITGGPSIALDMLPLSYVVNRGQCFSIDISAYDDGLPGTAENLVYSPMFTVMPSEYNVGKGLTFNIYNDGSCTSSLASGFTLPSPTGPSLRTIYGKFTGSITTATDFDVVIGTPFGANRDNPWGVSVLETITVNP